MLTDHQPKPAVPGHANILLHPLSSRGIGSLDVLLSHQLGRGEISASKQCEEFLSTPARAAVVVPQALLEGLGEGNQHLVTSFVPVAVVDALETINIHRQQGIGGIVPLGAVILAATTVHNQPPVGKTRELVMGGGFLQRFVQVVEHRLIAVRDPDRFLKLADLQVIAP